ncbi:MAG: helix-turn-helix transcriptional regulator [Bacteroidetes bacterium]|nr:helix-turn-helix transcriptional regulator [Bacteroidota bacterium]
MKKNIIMEKTTAESSFTLRLIAARKAKGWTQSDLANALNVNLKNVSRWELGQAKPTMDAAADLARTLDVSLDYLAGSGTGGQPEALELLFREKLPELSPEQKNALKTILEAFSRL